MKLTYHTLCKAVAIGGAVVTLAGLAACGSKEGAAGSTQVAAKVGSEEISVHQINQVLGHTNTSNLTPVQVKALEQDVLEKLIDQQLAVDQAIDQKLQHSPDVVAEIESSRREILARAYLSQITADLPRPTSDDVHKYYVAHPELFAQRHLFRVQELVLGADPKLAVSLRNMADAGKSMDDIALWLRGQNIHFNSGGAVRAAEQVPLEFLAKVQALDDGQSLVMDLPQSLTVLHVVARQSAPVAEEAAVPRIQQYLANQRAMETVKSTLKQLRTSTKIVYMGQFDRSKPAPDIGAGLLK